MEKEDIIIKFMGFTPSEFTNSYIRRMIHEIFEEAPYGATLSATFSRADNTYKGMINIASSAGPFFGFALGENIHEVGRKLENQIHRRLMKWKSKRFRNSTLTDKKSATNFIYERER